MGSRQKNLTAIILLTVALAFIAIGVWREEAETVLLKAINICLECIGLE